MGRPFDGEPDVARDITALVIRSRSPRIKAQVIPLLHRLGEVTKSADLRERMATLDLERSTA